MNGNDFEKKSEAQLIGSNLCKHCVAQDVTANQIEAWEECKVSAQFVVPELAQCSIGPLYSG